MANRKQRRVGPRSAAWQTVQQPREHPGRMGKPLTEVRKVALRRAGADPKLCVDCGHEKGYHIAAGDDRLAVGAARKEICTYCLRYSISGLQHKFRAAGKG